MYIFRVISICFFNFEDNSERGVINPYPPPPTRLDTPPHNIIYTYRVNGGGGPGEFGCAFEGYWTAFDARRFRCKEHRRYDFGRYFSILLALRSPVECSKIALLLFTFLFSPIFLPPHFHFTIRTRFAVARRSQTVSISSPVFFTGRR